MNQPNNPPAGGKKFRKFSGVVVSNKMPKTLVVEVWRTKTHQKYQKQFKVKKRFKVHTPDSSKFTVGQQVDFVECRPLSRDKRWRVLK